MQKNQRGFSLIELLIVVAIILVIAAIAIPNLMRSRMAANEASAVGSLRTINTAQITYSMNYPEIGFADALASLGGAAVPCVAAVGNGCLIDNTLALGTKSGYTFSVASSGGTPVVTYTTLADPVALDQTGSNSFCSDESGVIYYLVSATGCTPGTATGPL